MIKYIPDSSIVSDFINDLGIDDPGVHISCNDGSITLLELLQRLHTTDVNHFNIKLKYLYDDMLKQVNDADLLKDVRDQMIN